MEPIRIHNRNGRGNNMVLEQKYRFYTDKNIYVGIYEDFKLSRKPNNRFKYRIRY